VGSDRAPQGGVRYAIPMLKSPFEVAPSPRARPFGGELGAGGRVRCAGCGLRGAQCLCGELVPVAVRTRVVLIVHRDEIRKSTNTGRLVAGLLEGAEIRVRGERDAAPRPPLPAGRRLVLYPVDAARELTPDDARGEPVVLLVPDGTWPQARRAFLRDPDLRGVEAVRLPSGSPSHYGLRRSPRRDALSTLEAVARAMAVLEGDAVAERMMRVFDAFVARSHRAAGRFTTVSERR
jgi:DTW domain-containing protein YfiP